MRFLPVIVLIGMVLLTSCGSDVIFEENKAVAGQKWNRNEPLSFTVDITDTVSSFNMYINLRHTGDYGYSNMYMFINTLRPDGKSMRDTVECILQDNEGKWLGSGIGDIYDNRLVFHQNVRFPNAGPYTFRFEHAMRDEILEGVSDVGMRVEKRE